MVPVATVHFCPRIQEDDSRQPFMEQPLCTYYGHTADVLDLSWSKVNHARYYTPWPNV